MYNPYLDDEDFLPIEGEKTPPKPETFLSGESPLPQLAGDIMSKLGALSLFSKKEKPLPRSQEKEEGTGGAFQGLKERLHLEDIDSGDVLLVIIVIYLMLEGDDTLELAITMGILALMWYLEHKDKAEDEGDPLPL